MFDHFSRQNCTHDRADLQSVGRVAVYDLPLGERTVPSSVLFGTESFTQFGYNVKEDVDNNVLAIQAATGGGSRKYPATKSLDGNVATMLPFGINQMATFCSNIAIR